MGGKGAAFVIVDGLVDGGDVDWKVDEALDVSGGDAWDRVVDVLAPP